MKFLPVLLFLLPFPAVLFLCLAALSPPAVLLCLAALSPLTVLLCLAVLFLPTLAAPYSPVSPVRLPVSPDVHDPSDPVLPYPHIFHLLSLMSIPLFLSLQSHSPAYLPASHQPKQSQPAMP